MSRYFDFNLVITGYQPQLEDQLIEALDDGAGEDGEGTFKEYAEADSKHTVITSDCNLRLSSGWSIKRFAADITLRLQKVDPGAKVEISANVPGPSFVFSADEAAAIVALGEDA